MSQSRREQNNADEIFQSKRFLIDTDSFSFFQSVGMSFVWVESRGAIGNFDVFLRMKLFDAVYLLIIPLAIESYIVRTMQC